MIRLDLLVLLASASQHGFSRTSLIDGGYTYIWRKLGHGPILLGSHGSVMNSSAPGARAHVLNPKDVNPSPSRSGTPIAAILGGVAGAVVLILITLVLVCLSLIRGKRYSSRQSETSSDHSIQVWTKQPGSPLVVGRPPVSEAQTCRRFSLAELEHATKQWSSANFIGAGRFGVVYKGLLEDGTIVAIKKRGGIASQEFAAEVGYLAHIRHKHLVILVGFCQENDQQMVVYDYLPNGSINGHLYDEDGHSLGKLEFKQRLAIALGAARGLEHLHSLVPPLVHADFKTSNVLVDENFVPKVTDYGLSRLLKGEQEASSSSSRLHTVDFQDPGLQDVEAADERSDVYSFGVFLLELVSGRESTNSSKPEPGQRLIDWAHLLLEKGGLATLVDDTLGGNFTKEAIQLTVKLAFKCIELVVERRPSMKEVVNDLAEITEMECRLLLGADGLASVALGSELFSRMT